MSTSGQFLTVPSLAHRSSQHTRIDRAHSSLRSRPTHVSATGHVASSSKVKLEDTPLGIPVPTPPITTTEAESESESSSSSPPLPPPTSSLSPTTTDPRKSRAPPRQQPLMAPTLPPKLSSSSSSSSSYDPAVQSPPLSPRSLFRIVPLLLRLRPSPSDIFTLSCSSGDPRTHVALITASYQKFPHTLICTKTLLCADGVNAEVLLRLARHELFERAQQANRHFTALVDEEYVLFFSCEFFFCFSNDVFFFFSH
jgi:hypothetical protein